MKINLNPFGHWFYDLWKQKEDEQEDFFSYFFSKYFRNENEKDVFKLVCRHVLKYNRFLMQDYHQFIQLGIPFYSYTKFNARQFSEKMNDGIIDSEIFLDVLSKMCDNKFTKEQIKQTIENE